MAWMINSGHIIPLDWTPCPFLKNLAPSFQKPVSADNTLDVAYLGHTGGDRQLFKINLLSLLSGTFEYKHQKGCDKGKGSFSLRQC